MTDLRLTAIGTSGSFPGPGSAASCYLVQWEADGRTFSVALDMGSGSLGALQAAVALADLDAVVLSHLHPDHCLDLTGLYVAITYDPRFSADDPDPGPFSASAEGRRQLDVWGPPGTAERMLRAYDTPAGAGPRTADVHPPALETAFRFRELADGEAFEIGGATFAPFLVDHPAECYALRITGADGGVLTYSGDTDTCPGLDAAAAGADLFLCEAAFVEGRDLVRGVHLTGLRAGQTAAEACVGRLVLTHLPPWTAEETIRAEAAEAYTGPTDVARPFDRWSVGADGAQSLDPLTPTGRLTRA